MLQKTFIGLVDVLKPVRLPVTAIALGMTALSAQAQTASEITPQSFTPSLQRLDGSLALSGQAGGQAPAGLENIGITLSGVDLTDPLPQMTEANDAFVRRLTRGRIPASELFEATSDLEAAYAEAGYVLTRVVLPQQTLRDGGKLRVAIVNGYVEAVDTQRLPPEIRDRVKRLTDGLVNRPGLTRTELERQLLLSGDVPGTALRSGLTAGDAPGSTIIGLEADYKRVTGFASFGNPTGPELGRLNLELGGELNSALGQGETFYGRISGNYQGFFSGDPRSRILAGGMVYPIGRYGTYLNIEATTSDTTPDETPATRSNFDRLSLRLIHPLTRGRQLNLTGQLALDMQKDDQSLLGGPQIYEDQLTILRAGLSLTYLHLDQAFSTASLFLSRGIDAFGARTLADVGAGTPLSRAGADAIFTKISGSFSHRRALSERIGLSVSGRFQSSFGDPLLTSEQFSLIGSQEVSTMDSGTLRGDSGWVLRSELSTSYPVTIAGRNFQISPYLFAGAGQAILENPTVLEQARTKAVFYGIGVDLLSNTNSLFRSSSLRIEYGRGERDDGIPDENRFSISGNIRF